MQLLSSTNSPLSLFPPPPSFSLSTISTSAFSALPLRAILRSPSPSSAVAALPSPLREDLLRSEPDREDEQKQLEDADRFSVRRPVKQLSDPEPSAPDPERSATDSSYSRIDKRISEFAKKMPIFEPERARGAAALEKPLAINLELGLYRAKVLTRNFEFKEAEEILLKCISYWPEDGRPYVALGKLLSKQMKIAEARAVYERGCQATQGENSYIWQCWAVLENKAGNIRRARELFDAATVADKKHVAAWHGWAVLEIKQGNIKKARNLLAKGLKYCGGNEYIYQTLALLEARGKRFEQARFLFQQATQCNPKSCASWLAWAQIEMQQENNLMARQLFEKAVQSSPKNRFAWHIWALFEANQGDIDKGRKLLKVGHAVNPRDPVILQSLALLEYKHSSANVARVLFRKASKLDPSHQPVWIGWGWMEWKEGNIGTARELYQRALSIDSTSESAARCLQAWGVLEQRIGNLSVARRLFRSSLNINSQNYITWMTWAQLEEDQGNPTRAEEIRNLYFQQRTEVVDDAAWVMGFLDIIDPALDSIKRFLNLDQPSEAWRIAGGTANNITTSETNSTDSVLACGDDADGSGEGIISLHNSQFDLDAFLRDKLSLEPSELDATLEGSHRPKKLTSRNSRIWRSVQKPLPLPPAS